MRILVVLHTPRSPYSSVFIHYGQLGEWLSAHGSRVDILTPDDFAALGRLHGRWLPLAYPPLVARWLARRRADYDLVVFHSYAGWASGLLRSRPAPSVTAFHGLEPLYYDALAAEMRRAGRPLRWRFRLLHGGLMPSLIRASLRRSSAALCLNAAERRFLCERDWCADVRQVVHGVSDEWFGPRVTAAEAHEILFVGQWLPMKGIRYLTAAFDTVAAAYPDLRLRCVGTLAGEDEVRAAFSEAVRSRVIVQPRVDHAELAPIYRAADLFVLPTLSEGFSGALLEAMASALPIVTTAVGAAPDLLADGRDCLMVPVADAGALAAGLTRLAGDAPLRARLGEAARASARGFTLEASLSRAAATLESLASPA
jgi:glycosyltransferase involved in cell wall biosynthesis